MPGKGQISISLRKALVEKVRRELSEEDVKNMYGTVTSFIEDAIRHRIEDIRKVRKEDGSE